MKNLHHTDPVLTILTALAAERKILDETGTAEKSNIEIIQCGMGCPAVLKTVSRMQRPTMIGSIGVSGGLAPALAPGTVILGDTILNSCRRPSFLKDIYRSDVEIIEFLASTMNGQGIDYQLGSLLCASQPLLSARDKAAAFLETGALAVDMESAGAAEAARTFGVPFFCLRVVCDPADRALDEQLLVGVDGRGNSRLLRLLGVICRHPRLVGRLLTMVGDFSRAAGSMGQVWKAIRRPLVDFAGKN
ncbi:MAG TPA: hypothetical protein ENK96_00635 [Desulfobulbaceae bacterium]|nr:hypothetical protein [Desulfobulbaceae bacterium]